MSVSAFKDSFLLVQEFPETENNNYVKASFDIVSLNTNLHPDHTLGIITNQVHQIPIETFNRFLLKLSKRLFNISCRDNTFIFNDVLYKQNDDAQMGGCVSSILANIFFCDYLKIYGSKTACQNLSRLFKNATLMTLLFFFR